MIDIEGLSTGPDATILTIAAVEFDPLCRDKLGKQYYVRVDLESQADRHIDQDTLDWWARQPAVIKDDAFSEQDRVPLQTALEGLTRMVWHSRRVWAQGPTYDMNILEHAYKSLNMALPWKFYSVRDSRTLFSLVPNLERYPASHNALEDCCCQIALASHNALEDCCCQIALIWDTLEYLKIKEIK